MANYQFLSWTTSLKKKKKHFSKRGGGKCFQLCRHMKKQKIGKLFRLSKQEKVSLYFSLSLYLSSSKLTYEEHSSIRTAICIHTHKVCACVLLEALFVIWETFFGVERECFCCQSPLDKTGHALKAAPLPPSECLGFSMVLLLIK